MTLDEVKRLVFEALGEASVCWSETPNGVFDSENAARIGDELMTAIEQHVQERVDEEERRLTRKVVARTLDGLATQPKTKTVH